jgi:arylsulfatase A-like enzyme
MCLPACQRPPESGETANHPNIVLVSIDSLRADHVGAYGYPKPTTPFLDRLAAQGVVFEDAVSNSAWTLPAHVTLFTGLLESAHAVRTPRSRLARGYPTLAEHLAAAGYATLGFYSGPFLHADYGLARGFDAWVDCTSFGVAGRDPRKSHGASHRDVTNPIIRAKVLERMRNLDQRPFFLFIHMWDVHYDLIPPQSYAAMFESDYSGDFDGRDFRHAAGFRPGMDPADFAHVMALYDGEIRFTDDTLAAIVDALTQSGRMDNTVLLVVSDHGEEFLEHGSKGHRHTLYQEVIRIPMIVWSPSRLEPRRIRGAVSLADVAPTLLDLAGAAPLEKTMGRPLTDLMENGGDASDLVVSELTAPPRARDLSAALRARSKIIVDHARGTTELYDLVTDPGELSPRPADASSTGKRLLRELERSKRSAAAIAAAHGDGGQIDLPSPLRDRLEELGYLD